ncbi:MCM DNA helicase complex subunit [Conglomerata obtusa]
MAKRKFNDEEEKSVSSDIKSLDEDSGESLFGSQMMDDYRERPELDEYEISDLTDEEIIDDILFENMPEETHELHEKEKDLKQILINFLNKMHKEIKNMCSSNHESLYVSYIELEKEISHHINGLIKDTEVFMQVFDSSLEHVVKTLFPNYKYIKASVHARIKDVPDVENIRSLRNIHLGTLIKVRGVITRRSSVFPQLSIVMYHCGRCSSNFGPLIHESDVPKICINCQSKGPHSIDTTETVYKDLQKVTIQEVPGTVPSGRLPRQKEVHLFFDLIDSCKPGEEVEITGIYKNTYNYALNAKNGFPVFSTIIEAITVEKKEDEIDLKCDVKEITNLSKHPQIKNLILNSIAPSIYGHKNVKLAIALAMFGGQRKENDGHAIRGDINVLLLGDPGTAKSQFLRYVESTSHRAVLATGQGASSVGLTASVRRDPMTKEWTLEGGALVLADKGVCLIDEFDKMDDLDRVSIHEAMEQQSISISKAGIVASLHARCSVIAAANPKRGIYNSNLTFGQNVNLSDPIISRFDILCVIKDVVSSEDKIMGDFIIQSHINTLEKMNHGIKGLEDSSTSDEQKNDTNKNVGKVNNKFSKTTKERNKENIDNISRQGKKYKNTINYDKYGNLILNQETLKKYILYSRKNCFPSLNEINKDKISQLYSELRKESMVAGSIPITARHIESIVRMSEAFARMKLRNTVLPDDIDSAIEVALESFMSAQKYSITKALRKKFIKYINAGAELFLYVLNELFNEKRKITESECKSVKVKEYEKRLGNMGLKFKKDFYDSEEFRINGYLLDKEIITRV